MSTRSLPTHNLGHNVATSRYRADNRIGRNASSTPMSEDPVTIRRAGLFERFYVTRHYLGMMSCVVISAKYAGRDGARLDKPIVFAALEKVIQNQGALCVALAGETSGRPAFVRLSKIDFGRIVHFVDEIHPHLPDVLEAQLLQRFDTNIDSPLWRLQVLQDGTVNFAWHHVIGDGQSGLVFHRALLAALNEVQPPSDSPADPPVVSIMHDVTLVKPIEDVISLSVSPVTFCREVMQLLIPASWTPSYTAWTGHLVPPAETLSARVRLLQYNSEDTKSIVGLCRAHNSTLTPFLHLVATSIISGLVAKDPTLTGKYKTISVTIPMSLRRLTKTSPDGMCNHISSFHHYTPLIDSVPIEGNMSLQGNFQWDFAAKMTKMLRDHLAPSTQMVGMLRFVSDYEAYLKSALGKKRKGTLEISNLGPFPSEHNPPGSHPSKEHGESSKWSITDMYFTQSHSATVSAIHINVVGTPSGGVGISVTWSDAGIDTSFGESFVSGFKQAIDEMIRTNP